VEHQPQPPFEDVENPYAAPKSGPLKPPREPYGAPGDYVFVAEAVPARVRLDAISEAWRVLSGNRGTWAGMTLLFMVVTYGIAFGSLALQFAIEGGPPAPGQIRQGSGLSALVNLVAQLLQLLASAYLSAGMFRAACRQVRGEPVRAGDIFNAGDVLGSTLWGMILMGLSIMGGLLLLIIPGLLVAGRLMFVLPLIADRRMAGGEALRASWGALRGQSWMSFFLLFASGLISGIGILLCCIGLLLTAPLYYLSIAIVYHDFFYTRKAAGPWDELV
jgi:hypothetical protein